MSTMGNNWGMGNWSMGNQWSMVDSVGNWGMGNNWSMSHNRGMVDSVVDWLSNIWDGLTLVPDISDETIVMISVVGDDLDTTVRKLNSVLS